MESNIKSPPSPDNALAKAEFRKLSNDAANRKYRRRSPVSGSSSSDGSPRHGHSYSPIHSKEDHAKGSDPRQKKDEERDLGRDSGRSRHGRNGDSYRYSDRPSSRSSHNYHRYDDYARREKYTDEEERNYFKSSSRSGRESRVGNHSDDGRRESEHYKSRDRSDASGHRSRDKEKENSFLEYQKSKNKYLSSDRAGSGRKHTNANVEDLESGERDRYTGNGDGRDEKRDYRRSLGDSRSARSPVYDSASRRDSGGHWSKEDSKIDHKGLNDQKYTKEERRHEDRETNRHRDRNRKELGENFEDGTASPNENQESSAKKAKLFSSDIDNGKNVSKFTTVADERQSSKSKQTQELVDNLTSEQAPAKGFDLASDIDAAKIAAMKAAELVNKNLIGTGYMSTDQKKKLLWGNKKSATTELGHRWDTAQFSDRDRQEKFNKLMSLRLHWYLWPIVGCQGRWESGAQTRESRQQCREAERIAAGYGFGEAIHCWTPSERWPNCWTRSLRIYSGCFCSCTKTCRSTMLCFAVRISHYMVLDLWLLRGICAVLCHFYLNLR